MSESSPESHTESTEPLHWVGRALAALATAAYRKPLIASLLIVLATALLGTGATRLRINPDLSELLPRSFDSVQNLDALRTEFGTRGLSISFRTARSTTSTLLT